MSGIKLMPSQNKTPLQYTLTSHLDSLHSYTSMCLHAGVLITALIGVAKFTSKFVDNPNSIDARK